MTTSISVLYGVPEESSFLFGRAMNYTAIALCRVSTIGQLRDGNLEPQEARIIRASEYLDVEIVKWWRLAISSRKGKNKKRKDLTEMLDYCKKNKKVKLLIVDEADRFMRSIGEYYWWKMEFEYLGVRLVLANRPDLDPNDDKVVFEELIDVYRAEQSNNDRITKTPEKMQAKIRIGYYPGVVHHGYKKTDIKGLHEPLQPQWTLLKQAGLKVLYEALGLHEALTWINGNGYEYGGRKLAMDKFKHILSDPYNGGIITMSNWDVINENGLHEAMFTRDEHYRLKEIVNGVAKKFTKNKKENKYFGLSNVGICEACLSEGKRGALTGYHHNNGKTGNSFKEYDRYRCRLCDKTILREIVHSKTDQFFDSVEFIEPKLDNLKKDITRVWKDEVNDNTQSIARLKQKLNILNENKDKLILSMATQPDLAEDIKPSIQKIKTDITLVNAEIDKLKNGDDDFIEFMKFAIDFVDNMKDHFWDLDRDDKQRCKELLFPGEIIVARPGKVYTQELSKFLRYKATKKAPKKELDELVFLNGGPGGTRTLDILLKRQTL